MSEHPAQPITEQLLSDLRQEKQLLDLIIMRMYRTAVGDSEALLLSADRRRGEGNCRSDDLQGLRDICPY
jgi:hypothetical protein